LGCQVTCNLKLYAGYSFLYWANILRAGEQIDIAIDSDTLPPGDPPGTQPEPGEDPPHFVDSDMWAHGLKFGLEYAF
jgi:hypothetical protein